MNKQKSSFSRCSGDLVVGAALAAATFAVYWGMAGHDFLSYDDPLYVTENPHLFKGLSVAGIRWAFTTIYANFWHPLTWLSYLADFEFFGIYPGGFLFTNLILHIFSALVLFAALRRMTGALWPSALVAALFALHPLNVESVAWVAERKNVLSTFFWMLTIWGYARYAQQPGWGRYLPVLVFFLLGLMAKPMLVTLPFALLLIDYWPLGRWRLFTAGQGWGRSEAWTAPVSGFRLVFEKLPFFLFSAVFSVIAYVAQDRGGALSSLEAFPLSVRAANAMVSYAAYLRKMVWPVDLAIFYPHEGMPPWPVMTGAVLVLLLVSAAVISQRRARPWLLVGWLWYLGTLVPVIGLVQIGIFAMADRFAYVPLIGVFIMVAYNGSRDRWRRCLLVSCWALALAGTGWTAQKQAGYWKDNATLFGHALAVSGSHPVIHNSLGLGLAENGDTQGAEAQYRKALHLDPSNGEVLCNLGVALAGQGFFSAAADAFHHALRLDPTLKKAHNNLGNLHAQRGELDQAVASYQRALQIDPLMAEALNNLGVALARQGNLPLALLQFRKALQIRPGHESARKNLARYFNGKNQNREGLPHVRR